MMKAHLPPSPEQELASFAGLVHDTVWLGTRFPDLRGIPEPLLRDVSGRVRLERFPAGSRVTSDAPDDDAPRGLRFVVDGEVMITRTQTSGASARVLVLSAGAVFSEAELEGLLNEVAPGVDTSDAPPRATFVDVEQTLGLSSVPGSRPLPGASHVDTTVASTIGLLDVRDLRALIDAGGDGWSRKDLVGFLVRVFQVNRFTDQALDALGDVDGLGRLTESERWWLLEGAAFLDWEAGRAEVVPPGALYLLLEGEVEVFAGEKFPCLVLKPGSDCVLPLHPEDRPVELRASRPSRLFAIKGDRIETLLRRNVGFRRKVVHNTLPGSQIGQVARDVDRDSLEVLGLARHPDLALPLSDEALVGLLAQAIRTQFGDMVVVVRPECRPGGRAASEEMAAHNGIPRIRVAASAKEIASAVQAVCRSVASTFDYALLDLSGWDDPPAELQHLVAKWSFLVSGPLERVGVERTLEAPVIPTVCVRQRGKDRAAARAPCPGGALAMPLRNTRLVLYEDETAGLRDKPDVPMDALPRSRPSIERWARAMTDRLVGVALGGGGALGLSHLPLLEAMHRRGIPVDIVSGTSFGAVVGAYFCSLQPDPGADSHPGLDRVREMMPRMSGLVLRCLFSGRVLEETVDRDLGSMLLEETPIPFIPVATNAGTMAPVFPADCTVGHGVWASGALPPLFDAPENEIAQVRFLDGAFVANVPADILVAAGAAMIVACNPISPPLFTSGWADRLEAIVGVLGTAGLHPKDRAVAVRAAMLGQAIDLDELERTPTEGVPWMAMRADTALSWLVRHNSRWLAAVYPSVREAWDHWRPRRLPDTVRGLQALAARVGAETTRHSDVVSSPPLTILAAIKFWRGQDIIAISQRDLEGRDTLDQIESEWRRLRRPVRGWTEES